MDFKVHKFSCNIAFSSNGHLLALGNPGGVINVWESSIEKLRYKLERLNWKCHWGQHSRN
jgi:hypothetical protein